MKRTGTHWLINSKEDREHTKTPRRTRHKRKKERAKRQTNGSEETKEEGTKREKGRGEKKRKKRRRKERRERKNKGTQRKRDEANGTTQFFLTLQANAISVLRQRDAAFLLPPRVCGGS